MQILQNDYKKATEILKQGGIIAYKTDTIWGFGCDPLNHKAIKKLQELKKRPNNKGFILLSSHFHYVKNFIKPKLNNRQIIQITNSKNTSWVIPTIAENLAFAIKTEQNDTIAIRLTNFQSLVKLSNFFKSSIISTSINQSGQQYIDNIEQILNKYQEKINAILITEFDNTQKKIKPSKIIKLINYQRLR